MNRLCGLCLVVVASPVLAQQAPGAIKPHPPAPPILGQISGTTVGQPAPPAIALQPSGEEIARLLRAQTDALRALAVRLDQLERRIDRVERGGR